METVDMRDHSFFLLGGRFLNDLESRLQAMGRVTGRVIGISPLSRVNRNTQEDTLTFWLPELDFQLESSGAEYCIVDLQQACRKLLVSGGYYLTASYENFERLERKEIAQIDPMILTQEQVDRAIDQLAQVLGRHFDPAHLILIHMHTPDYYLSGNNLRLGKTKGKQNQWLAKLEERFCRVSGCHYIDVTRFYFNQKEPGRPVTDVIFEKECYEDVARRIRDILSGGDGASVRPDFGLSLNRYANYYFTLQRKPQRIFLNGNYFLDKLILSAGDHFVNEYRAELIALDVLDWSQPERALAEMKADDPLLKVLKAFLAAAGGRYDQPDVDYACLFQNQVVPLELLEYLKREYAPGAGLLPCQINPYNAGWHFAKMRGLDPKPFCTARTVAEPVVIDIFGSCVSRTAFNVLDHDFAVNRYWFHVPPFEHMNKPVDYPAELFGEKLSWTDRLVKLQFDGEINGDISRSEGEWLIIDLYSLISPNNFYFQNCLYGDFDHNVSKQLKARKVDIYRDPSIVGDKKEMLQQMVPWLDLVRKKYGKNLILIDCQRMDHWIGDDDKIYWAKHYSCNPFLEQAAEFVCERTGAYRVKIGKYFLSDELGFMRKTPAHKEDVCYRQIHDIVRYIVDERPEQKCFDSYPGHIQLHRLMRLVKNSPAVLEAAMPLTQLDKAVIRLNDQERELWKAALAELYNRSDWNGNLETVLGSDAVPPQLAQVLNAAARRDGGADTTVPRDYPDYPDELRRFAQENGRDGVFDIPKIEAQKIGTEKDEIRIKWSVPDGTLVGVFRRSGEEPWRFLGESETGKFVDKSATAGVRYQYSLCVITEYAGRRCLGGFTTPRSEVIGAATPILISAVHISGENILRWAPVAGAEGYRIYHKADLSCRWEHITTVEAEDEPCFTEKYVPGAWYTVRAVKTVDGKRTAGGFQPGLCAEAL